MTAPEKINRGGPNNECTNQTAVCEPQHNSSAMKRHFTRAVDASSEQTHTFRCLWPVGAKIYLVEIAALNQVYIIISLV